MFVECTPKICDGPKAQPDEIWFSVSVMDNETKSGHALEVEKVEPFSPNFGMGIIFEFALSHLNRIVFNNNFKVTYLIT